MNDAMEALAKAAAKMGISLQSLGRALERCINARGPSAVVVGSSNPDFWYRLEGKDPMTVCRMCDGDGVLTTADIGEPETPDKLIDCPDCKGTGVKS